MFVSEELREQVIEHIKPVIDPEIGISLWELGLIYKVIINGDQADIKMTLTSMACPAGPEMVEEIKTAAESVEGITEASVEVIWSPPWDPKKMASEEAQMMLGIL